MEILVAEDSDLIRSVLARMVSKWDYRPVTARNGKEAWNILNSTNPSRLALVDWVMPGMDGIDLCKKIKGTVGFPFVYMIILSGKSEKVDVALGLDSGADDFIIKPPQTDELRSRLAVGVRILGYHDEIIDRNQRLKKEVEEHKKTTLELEKAIKELDLISRTDPLTGLSNRRDLYEKLHYEEIRYKRHKNPFSFIISDVDHFKKINDEHGHGVGDFILTRIADILKSSSREQDTVGRWGGEEFLAILPETALNGAAIVAEKIRTNIEANLFRCNNKEYKVTMSLGVSHYDESTGEIDQCIKKADECLYKAKEMGKNRVVAVSG